MLRVDPDGVDPAEPPVSRLKKLPLLADLADTAEDDNEDRFAVEAFLEVAGVGSRVPAGVG